tara:strand:+ start:95 stop:289 length:195 start_codon:yes stop_codon:yes gene_type:complete
VKVGDIVALKEDWRIKDVYYGLGVITFIEQGVNDLHAWKSYKVQWNDDFSFHEEEQLELISESR